MPLKVQQQCGCKIGVDYPMPIVVHSKAYEHAKSKLQSAREAMGFPQAVKRSRQRDAAVGSRDIVDMFAQSSKRQRCASAAGEDDSKPKGCGSLASTVDADAKTKQEASLVSLGFPPDIVAKAVALFPSDINKAADWILSGTDW